MGQTLDISEGGPDELFNATREQNASKKFRSSVFYSLGDDGGVAMVC